MLRLQQYEGLMKAIAASYDVTYKFDETGAPITKTEKGPASSKTLGQLVGDLLGSFIVAEAPENEEDARDAEIGSTVRIRFKIEVSDFARIERGLKELVALRNGLVHHFIEQHNLFTPEGCRGASKALMEAYDLIDRHVEELLDWARDVQRLHKHMLDDDIRQAIEEALVACGPTTPLQ